MKCTCGNSSQFSERQVDERLRLKCGVCARITYTNRSVTNSFHCIADQIVDTVVVNGRHEVAEQVVANLFADYEQFVDWVSQHDFKLSRIGGRMILSLN